MARAVTKNVFYHCPYLQSALGDGESDSGAKYADEIVKLQREFDRRFQDSLIRKWHQNVFNVF